MTSKLQIPTISEENKMSTVGIKGLVGRKMEKTVKFMGQDLKINKLLVSEVLDIQQKAKNIEKEDTDGLEILKTVIRAAAEGGKDLTDEDFNGFPIDELSKLSEAIMQHSGLGKDQGK